MDPHRLCWYKLRPVDSGERFCHGFRLLFFFSRVDDRKICEKSTQRKINWAFLASAASSFLCKLKTIKTAKFYISKRVIMKKGKCFPCAPPQSCRTPANFGIAPSKRSAFRQTTWNHGNPLSYRPLCVEQDYLLKCSLRLFHDNVHRSITPFLL